MEQQSGGQPDAGGVEAAPNNHASDGGDQTPVAPSPEDRWNDPTLNEHKNSFYKRARAEGKEKGIRDAREAFLSDLGFESVDSLKQALLGEESQQQDDEPRESGDLLKLNRKLKKERTETQRLIRQQQSDIDRLQRYADKAFQHEVEKLSLELGINPKAAGQFFQLVKGSLRWNKDDTEIVVVDPDGEPTITAVKDYLDEQLKNAPWFLEAPQKSGTGAGLDRVQPTVKKPTSFAERHKALLERRGG